MKMLKFKKENLMTSHISSLYADTAMTSFYCVARVYLDLTKSPPY